jgi:hypothetical protein
MSCMKKAAAKQLFLFKGFESANNFDNFFRAGLCRDNSKIAAIVEYSGYDFIGLPGAKELSRYIL